jgi:hypothetical protein
MANQARAYPSFCSIKQLGVSLCWNEMLVHCCFPVKSSTHLWGYVSFPGTFGFWPELNSLYRKRPSLDLRLASICVCKGPLLVSAPALGSVPARDKATPCTCKSPLCLQETTTVSYCKKAISFCRERGCKESTVRVMDGGEQARCWHTVPISRWFFQPFIVSTSGSKYILGSLGTHYTFDLLILYVLYYLILDRL